MRSVSSTRPRRPYLVRDLRSPRAWNRSQRLVPSSLIDRLAFEDPEASRCEAHHPHDCNDRDKITGAARTGGTVYRTVERDAITTPSCCGLRAPDEETIGGCPISESAGSVRPETEPTGSRAEQRLLRAARLSGRRRKPPCATWCGHALPAACVSPRRVKTAQAYCTEEERHDFAHNVAMLLCALGCDALFEWGYV